MVIKEVCRECCRFAWFSNVTSTGNVVTRAGLFVRRVCLAVDKLSFSRVVQLYKRFRLMYGEIKDKWTADTDVVAGYIVNETRDLSLDDFMEHSDHSVKSWCVFPSLHGIVAIVLSQSCAVAFSP